MNIVLATDNNYVQHCTITITSILKNNSDVNIIILTEDLTEENKRILREEVDIHNAKIDFILVDTGIIDKLPMPSHACLSHISRATYYRLLLPNLISAKIEKVIYLDCDLLVHSNLQELWNLNIENHAIGACKQIGGNRDAYRLGIPKEYGYFNAGVLLINVKYWRDNNISNSLITFLTENIERVVFHDQDALNAVLYDKCLHLHQRWNMNYATYYKEYLAQKEEYLKEIEEALDYQNNPSILHYSARKKPWNWQCTHPLQKLYYDYAKQTQHFNTIQYPSIFVRCAANLREKTISMLVKIKHLCSDN